MEIRELVAQENLVSILVRTLEHGWTVQRGHPHTVTAGPSGDQKWRAQSMLSAYCVDGVIREARAFMMDRFRYSSVVYRMPFQWALGTLLGSAPGLRVAGREAFSVTPPIPTAEGIVVIPGSRRIRTFDFGAGTTRSMLKVGFSSDALSREIEVRSADTGGPFLPLDEYDEKQGWFEEEIVPGVVLARCPTWRDRAGFERIAIRLINEWLERSSSEEDGGTHARSLLDSAITGLARVTARFEGMLNPPTANDITLLADHASRLGPVQLAVGHGDFQPGNILIRASDGAVFITDWEHSARRWRYFDAFTYGLKAKYTRGLTERARRYVDEATMAGPEDLVPPAADRLWRLRATAMFLLEELARAVAEIATEPYDAPPISFRHLCREIRLFSSGVDKET